MDLELDRESDIGRSVIGSLGAGFAGAVLCGSERIFNASHLCRGHYSNVHRFSASARFWQRILMFPGVDTNRESGLKLSWKYDDRSSPHSVD